MLVLALVASMLVTIVSASAQDDQAIGARSPLEEPDPVLDVRLSLTGSDMLDDVTALGIDIGHGLRRVPTGIEVDATLAAELMPALEELGVEMLPLGEGWDGETDDATPSALAEETAAATFGALASLFAHEDTVRIAARTGSRRRARASSMSRRGRPRASRRIRPSPCSSRTTRGRAPFSALRGA